MVSAVQAPGGCGGFVRKLQLSEGFARTQVSNIQPKRRQIYATSHGIVGL